MNAVDRCVNTADRGERRRKALATPIRWCVSITWDCAAGCQPVGPAQGQLRAGPGEGWGLWPHRGGQELLLGVLQAMYPGTPRGDLLRRAAALCPGAGGGYAHSMTPYPRSPHLLRHLRANLSGQAERRRAGTGAGRVGLAERCAGRLDEDLDGLQLSAGETRLLVIARILLSHRPLIVLDGPPRISVTAACARWRSCSIATGPRPALPGDRPPSGAAAVGGQSRGDGGRYRGGAGIACQPVGQSGLPFHQLFAGPR